MYGRLQTETIYIEEYGGNWVNENQSSNESNDTEGKVTTCRDPLPQKSVLYRGWQHNGEVVRRQTTFEL
ncbi:MAG: hypothetical protein OHK0012_10140 [Synechococcales cyanobacterium]